MPGTVPQPTPIYHITHIDNLPSILADGGLRCCADLRQSAANYRDIAYQHIQDRRARISVPCGPRGLLHDYVPFYFGPRSPMLFTISRGNVDSYQGRQYEIVHLVTQVQTLVARAVPFVFTDGHATMMTSQFFDELERLDQIDWPLMTARDWYVTNQYPDRKQRRQAELLVHRSLGWAHVTEIGVHSLTMRQRVEALLAGQASRPVVSLRRHWYY